MQQRQPGEWREIRPGLRVRAVIELPRNFTQEETRPAWLETLLGKLRAVRWLTKE